MMSSVCCIDMQMSLKYDYNKSLHLEWEELRSFAFNSVYEYIHTKGIKEYSQMPECCQLPAEEIAKREAAKNREFLLQMAKDASYQRARSTSA